MKLIIILTICAIFLKIPGINAQNKTIKGRVLDALDSTEIQGVSVVIKGSSRGTVTDKNGIFNIDVPENSQTLVFSFVGMKTQEIPVTSDFTIITLQHDFIGISEIVAVGYSEKGKNEITGSTYQVKNKLISNVPVTSADQALQGKVPGLVVSAPSGTPGTMQDIRIRGVGSITASNQPLFVIDGVPVINPDFTGEVQRSTFSALSSLKSSDIESITVLKDASATSAYGARGSNGVIVITTKKGRTGETRFSLNTSVGFQNNATEGLTMLNGTQREELMLEAVHNTFNVPIDQAYNYLVEKGINYSLKTWVETYNRKEGNWGELLKNKNALIQNYDISAAGGDEVSNFYASLGYNNTETTVSGGEFSRISGKFNYKRQLAEKVDFSVNMMVSNTKQDAFLEQSAYFGNPIATRYMMSPWEQPYLTDGVTLNTATTSSYFNTLYTLENDIFQNDLTRGMFNSFIEWEILENLVFKSVYAGDYNVAAFHSYQNRIHGDGKAKGGTGIQSVTRIYNWVSQNSINYLIHSGDHQIGVKALMEYQENNSNFLSGSGEKFPADGLYYLSAANSNLDANAGFTDWKNLSYLGMANYNFKNKYIADLTYRYEGSSLFAPDSRVQQRHQAGTT